MERVVDLDEAAGAIAERQPAWQAAGLVAEPVTWRDEADPWPQEFKTDRSRVKDPDSIGIHLHGPNETELVVVLFRDGWADIDCIADVGDAGVIPTPALESVMAFTSLLDTCIRRVFGANRIVK